MQFRKGARLYALGFDIQAHGDNHRHSLRHKCDGLSRGQGYCIRVLRSVPHEPSGCVGKIIEIALATAGGASLHVPRV